MANERVYCKGLTTFAKNEKAPDWVLGTLIIAPETLLDWLINEGKDYMTVYNNQKQIKFQVTKGKDGKLQIAVDTFKPTKHVANTTATNSQSDETDLPF